jgi:putative long chain acyl-CoA synthase
MSLGGAVAGGARIAMAASFDPTTFWDEVRRYGVTVTSYTWTLLHDLVEAPPHPNERHHPLRLFIGSGMPRGLWRRVEQRFSPGRVLEFYASTEADAILVNVSGAKRGAMGRRLPGTAELRIAEYDAERGRLVEGPDGLAIECGVDEPGMLLASVGGSHPNALRGVFASDDAWLPTGDLFRRDADGDFWLVDNVPALIRTPDGMVPSKPIRDALEELPAIDLSVCFGVPGSDGFEVPVAAVTLRAGHELGAAEVSAALAALEPDRRPAIVRVVDEIPVTTWYRPLTGPLRAAGIPTAEHGRAFALDRASGGYRPLTAGPREAPAAHA